MFIKYQDKLLSPQEANIYYDEGLPHIYRKVNTLTRGFSCSKTIAFWKFNEKRHLLTKSGFEGIMSFRGIMVSISIYWKRNPKYNKFIKIQRQIVEAMNVAPNAHSPHMCSLHCKLGPLEKAIKYKNYLEDPIIFLCNSPIYNIG